MLFERKVSPTFLRLNGGALDDKITGRKQDPRHVFERFREHPLSGAAIGAGAASGTAQAINKMHFRRSAFEYQAIGTQTILSPDLGVLGLDIGMDQANNDGVEITLGNSTLSHFAFVAGTDDCYLRVKANIADVSGTDGFAVGFRKVQSYATALATYTDKACLNAISGDIKSQTLLNNAGGVITDTTLDWADGETHTFELRVGKNRIVTYLVDGVVTGVPPTFTFDSGDSLIPFLWFIHDSDVAGAVELIEWECGTLDTIGL